MDKGAKYDEAHALTKKQSTTIYEVPRVYDLPLFSIKKAPELVLGPLRMIFETGAKAAEAENLMPRQKPPQR